MAGSSMDESGLAGCGADHSLISAERDGYLASPDRTSSVFELGPAARLVEASIPVLSPALFPFFSLSAMLPCLLPNHRILVNAPRGAAWGCLPEQGGGMGLGAVCIVWRGGRVVLGWR